MFIISRVGWGILLGLLIVCCVWGAVLCSGSPDSVNEVVSEYVSAAQNGDTAAIETISARWRSLDSGLTEQSDDEKSGPLKSEVRPRYIWSGPKTPSDVYLGWVRKEFPAMLLENQLELEHLGDAEIAGNKARVFVVFKNERISDFQWTFLLLKDSDGWKVVDITTPDKAIDFLTSQ